MLKQISQIFTIKFISVLIISFPSAIIADYFNIPLAWFLGPMIVTSIAALSGLKIIMPKIVLSFILIILGLHIGNYIDQNLFNQIFDWIWTSLIMLIYIIICILVVAKYLQKFASYGEKVANTINDKVFYTNWTNLFTPIAQTTTIAKIQYTNTDSEINITNSQSTYVDKSGSNGQSNTTNTIVISSDKQSYDYSIGAKIDVSSRII